MKNVRKINLSDISDKQALSIDQLSKIIGGSIPDACGTGVCTKHMDANTKYCKGGSVCTSAVSTCTTNADTNDEKDENNSPTCATGAYMCTSNVK